MMEKGENRIEAIPEDRAEKTKRKLVVPGEVITEGEDYLPGDGARREKKEIISSKFGLAEESGRIIKVIPLSGVYIPRRRNIIIGKVTDVTFNGWVIDINAPYQSFLPLMESPRFVSKENITDYMDIGDMICAMVDSIKRKGVDLTTKTSRGLGKLEDGMIISINSNKVPRIIGREGSMIGMIKDETGCNITVGQNGKVWISGTSIENELSTKNIIEFIAQNATINGLTKKVEKRMKELGMKVKNIPLDVEIIAENTDEENNNSNKGDEE